MSTFTIRKIFLSYFILSYPDPSLDDQCELIDSEDAQFPSKNGFSSPGGTCM